MYIYDVTILDSGEIIDSGHKLHTPLSFFLNLPITNYNKSEGNEKKCFYLEASILVTLFLYGTQLSTYFLYTPEFLINKKAHYPLRAMDANVEHNQLLDSCGGRNRTCDLQVMSLASYQLLHSAILFSYLRGMLDSNQPPSD